MEITTGVLIFGNGETAKVAREYALGAVHAHNELRRGSQRQVYLGTTVDPEYLGKGLRLSGLELPFDPGTLKRVTRSEGVSSMGKLEEVIEQHVFPSVSYSQDANGVPNGLRQRVIESCLAWDIPLYSVIVPKLGYFMSHSIGPGSWIQEHCNIQVGSRLGKGVVVWSSGHVGHSSELGDYVYVTSGAVICGNCKIGNNTFIGANSVIHPRVTIGKRCIISDMARITKDVPDDTVMKAGTDQVSSRKSYEVDLK